MIATIVILSIAAYMLGVILMARWRYQALDLRRYLDSVLADPRYGCGINMLHVDATMAQALDDAHDAAACA